MSLNTTMLLKMSNRAFEKGKIINDIRPLVDINNIFLHTKQLDCERLSEFFKCFKYLVYGDSASNVVEESK